MESYSKQQVVRRIQGSGGFVLLRLPNTNFAGHLLSRSGVKYGAEVVGDPFDVFKALGRIYRPFAGLARRKMLSEVAGSELTSYVTARYLQKRYPGRGEFSYSSNDLPDSYFQGREIVEFEPGRTINLLWPRRE